MKTIDQQLAEIESNAKTVLCPEMLIAMNQKYNELKTKQMENYYPPDFDKEFENTCGYCGEPCEKDFCSKTCLNAFFND